MPIEFSRFRAKRLGLCLGKEQAGFTVIELVMVMLLVGILAVFVAPRFNPTDFNVRAFHDQTRSLLRYAQKSAVAQRRTVCVTFTSTQATLTVDADRSSVTGSNGCESNLTGPDGDTPGVVTARGTVTYVGVPAAFRFDALGQASAAQTFSVAGAANSITVELATGYVHE
jgi:MSHA pilin protein MshC